MILRPSRHVGLQALAALLLLLTGVVVWAGTSVPDPKSCLALMARSVQNPAGAELDRELRRACRRPTGG